MSAEATGYVYRHSPYSGVIFAVHLAVADSVNDQNDNQFWMSSTKVSSKARTTRQSVSSALQILVLDGYLEEVSRKDGWTVRYRFHFPDSRVVYESRWRGGVTSADRGVSSQATGGVKPVDISPIEPKVNPNTYARQNDEFLVWYNLYPRKVGRKDAQKAYNDARRTVEPDVLLDGLASAQGQWKAERLELKFIPYPASWLRSARWQDNVAPVETMRPSDESLTHGKSSVSALFHSGASKDDILSHIEASKEHIKVELAEFYEGLCRKSR